MGGGPPQAPRVHRRGRRSAQPDARWASGRCSSATSSTTSARSRTPTSSSATRATSRKAGGTARVQPRPARARASAPSLLCVVLGIGWGLLAAGIHAVMYVFVLSSSINGLCHHVGYKNFDNTATNIRLLALLTGGEGLHNNHHGYPRSPKFSFRAQRDRSRVADHQAADRAAAREAVQDDRRSRGAESRRSACCVAVCAGDRRRRRRAGAGGVGRRRRCSAPGAVARRRRRRPSAGPTLGRARPSSARPISGASP